MPMRPPTGRGLEARHERDANRRNAAIRLLYHREPWRLLRLRVIAEAVNMCAQCRRVVRKLDVDHIVPHRGDLTLFWDRGNLQALCRQCHRDKTMRGD